jgi:hypothetical protein
MCPLHEAISPPRLSQNDVQEAEVNWAPLSVVMVSGTPKRATHEPMKARTQAAADISFRGTASNQHVVLSIIVMS